MNWNHARRAIWTVAMVLVAARCAAEDVEAFTEPYKQVAIPAPEIGVISQILVQEGDRVSADQLLARLDDDLLQASLAVAEAAKDAEGAKRTAEVDLELRINLLEGYRQLQDRGNATRRELERAESEYQQSLARLQGVHEDLEIRRLEYMRVKSQIENRIITAPIDGHVISIVKQIGEFVSPTDPIIMHVAQLKLLKAVFTVPVQARERLESGQVVTLRVGDEARLCNGVIEFVSPIADPESGTIRVKIRIPNETGRIQSGVVCRWDQASKPASQRMAQPTGARSDRTNR